MRQMLVKSLQIASHACKVVDTSIRPAEREIRGGINVSDRTLLGVGHWQIICLPKSIRTIERVRCSFRNCSSVQSVGHLPKTSLC